MTGAILQVLLLLMCCVQAAVATSVRSLELRQVSSRLTVVVTHRKKPIAGIKVQIIPEKRVDPVFTSSTDERGIVLIDGLAAGRYYLTASYEEFEAGKEWIEVVAVPKAKIKKRFDFQWADWSYQTRRVAGTLTGLVPGNTGHPLMDIAHPNPTVYPGVAITLKNAFAEDERHTISDSTGAFLFDHVPEGIYILTIEGGMKSIAGNADITRQVIDVIRTGDRDSLPLELKGTGLGGAEFELADR